MIYEIREIYRSILRAGIMRYEIQREMVFAPRKIRFGITTVRAMKRMTDE